MEDSRAGSLRGKTGASSERVSRVLQSLLLEMAAPLMQAGITPRLFGDLAARAFVKAACRASTLRNGRVNQSRVAVLTGLSRAEVRKLMHGPREPISRYKPRTIRVVEGWNTDRRFLNRNGDPKALRINGPRPSFAALVRLYAGDVPHQAVLEELKRLQLVKESNHRIELTGRPAHMSLAFIKSLKSLVPLIADGVPAASDRKSLNQKAIHRLTLTASDSRDLVVMYERAIAGAVSYLSGLDHSLPRSSSHSAKKSNVTISVLVRQRGSERKTRRQANVP
ncbi:MAG: DUF6502 family protein [Gammaproteobacteria bacterium]